MFQIGTLKCINAKKECGIDRTRKKFVFEKMKYYESDDDGQPRERDLKNKGFKINSLIWGVLSVGIDNKPKILGKNVIRTFTAHARSGQQLIFHNYYEKYYTCVTI